MRVLYNRLIATDWAGPQEIKQAFGTSADFVGDNRVIFDVSGNKYRVIIAFAYAYKRGLIKFVGTHADGALFSGSSPALFCIICCFTC